MRKGFSLVELSIVLVILGLLVGGILAGKSLIRAAELRAVGTEYNRYRTAFASFKDKYFSLAGDMTNATSFWGTASVCPGVQATPAAGVCNGDGTNTLSRVAANSNEPMGAWEHLAMAGLIEGSYTGNTYDASTGSTNSVRIGTNIPGSKLNGAGWTPYHIVPVTISDVTYFEGSYGIIFFFGTGSGVTNQPALKPEEAWNIDTKLDDGLPAKGNVLSREAEGGTCSDLAPSAVASLAASVYLLSNTDTVCVFVMRLAL